jgi:hypothetical protein
VCGLDLKKEEATKLCTSKPMIKVGEHILWGIEKSTFGMGHWDAFVKTDDNKISVREGKWVRGENKPLPEAPFYIYVDSNELFFSGLYRDPSMKVYP